MSAAIFDGIAAGLKADPSIAKKANGVFQFNLSKPASEWVVDCKAATVTPGKAAKADVTLTLSDADFVAMAAGKLNGMQAFMSGKLKIKVRARRPPSLLHPRLHRDFRSRTHPPVAPQGNMALAQKFGALTDAAKKHAGKAAPAAAAPAASSSGGGGDGPAGFASTAIFETIAAGLKANPAAAKKVRGRDRLRRRPRAILPRAILRRGILCVASAQFSQPCFRDPPQVNGVFQFNITKGPGGKGATWTVDAKGGNCVKPSAPPKADCTITISDADFVAMSTGKLNGMQAFMSGKMKIKGNMALAQKFGALVDQKKSKL